MSLAADRFCRLTSDLQKRKSNMLSAGKLTPKDYERLLSKTESFAPSHAVDLKAWLEGHSDEAPTSSNVPSQFLPFQRWYRFKEAFSPLFVIKAIRSLDQMPHTCLDPFGGSGTTALTCQFLGIRPTTIEVNPFLADLIEAKLGTYDIEHLVRSFSTIRDMADQLPAIGVAPPPGSPPTLCQPGDAGRWIFDRAIYQRIRAFLTAIEALPSRADARLFKILLGANVVGVSNVIISGKGRRYRRSWENISRDPSELDDAFERSFLQAIADIARYGNRACSQYTLLRGDSRALVRESEESDFCLFSPPYPNSFDYTDIYNVELWALGYLKENVDNRNLRMSTLRSHVQIKGRFSWTELESPTLKRTIRKLNGVKADLWDNDIPDMVGSYFEDMAQILSGIRDRLARRGSIMIVIGNSRYSGVTVDVSKIITEMCSSLSLRVKDIRPIRSMRSSPQQGGKNELAEYLIWLKR